MNNRFDQHIKQSLENFEAEYNPADWADMQDRLSKVKTDSSSGKGKTWLIAASAVVTAGLVYYFSSQESTPAVAPAQTTEQVQEASPATTEALTTDNTTGKNTTTQQIANDAAAAENKSSEPVEQAANKNISETKQEPVVSSVVENKSQSAPEQPVVQPAATSAQALTATFRADNSKVCEGNAVQFTPDLSDPTSSYKWYFGDGQSSSEQSPKHIYAEAKAYTVKLQVTAKDKRKAEHKFTVQVVVKPDVRTEYSVSEENTMQVNFEADADKVSDWKWEFGDKQTSSAQNPTHTYKSYGKYNVTLTAKNAAGCAAVVAREVNIQLDLNAPNGFKPYGDGGNTWMPAALRNGEYQFTLTIFDKAGKTVFSTSDKDNGWDGKGTLIGDTFKWVATVKDKGGRQTQCQGLITIAE